MWRLAILALLAAVFFSLGLLARPSLSRLKHRSRLALQEQKAGVQVIDVTHYERQTAYYATLAGTKSIVFLGDSRIEWAEWSELLERSDISNRGISGDTTSGVLERLPSSVPTPGVVCVIQLGVNDLFLGVSVERVVENYRRIVDYLIKEKQARVILTSIILAGQQHDALNQQIAAANEQLVQVASSFGATWLDVNAGLSPDGYLDDQFSDDGVHLNGRGYQTISGLIAPLLPR